MEQKDFIKDVKKKMPAFIHSIKDFTEKTSGIQGKTFPCIHILLTYGDSLKPSKEKNEIKKLTFNNDFTATLDPEGLIIPREIEELVDERLNKTTRIKLNIMDSPVYLENLDDYLKVVKFGWLEVQRFNKKVKEEIEKKNAIPVVVERTEAVYNSQVYELLNTEEVKQLLDNIMQDISLMEYQIPEILQSIDWQKVNNVEHQEARLQILEDKNQTETDLYKKEKKEYEVQFALLERMEKNLANMVNEKALLKELVKEYRVNYIQNLESDLKKLQEKKGFINNLSGVLREQLNVLSAEGKG